MDFRFHFRRKSTLIRQKSPTDLKKILVGRLECRFPDGNEIHSRRLHQSNGNLFEHVKFYILPTFYTLIGWTLIKNALEFQLVEILNFEPVKLVCMFCILCASHFKRAVPGARYCTIHWTLSLRRCSHEQCWPTAHLLLVMLSIMDKWGWHCHSCCRWSWWLYCRRPTGYSVWYCSHRHPRRQEFKHTCTRPTTTTLNPLFLVVYRSIVCICTIKSSRFGLHLGGCGWKAKIEFPFYDKGPYLGFDENVNENWFSFPFP